MGGDVVTTQQLSCCVFRRGKEIKNHNIDHEKRGNKPVSFNGSISVSR